jgi:Rod binding domain-containing protein
MISLSEISHTNQAASQPSDSVRLVRAAQQFEAVLLDEMLSALEHTFSTLGKEKTDGASDHYHFLGMQALGSAIANHGGIGIADIIIRSLRRRESPEVNSLSKEQKSLSEFPSERLHLNF